MWDKLPERVFKNFTRAISEFSKFTRVVYAKNRAIQTCDYCSITLNQQILCIETNIF